MKRSIKIVPAILTDDLKEFQLLLGQAHTFSNWVQIDLMDGLFVPSRSIPPSSLLHTKPEVRWEAHMMMFYPERELKDLKKAGADRVIFHYEATDDHQTIINSCRELELGAGIALNPRTGIEVLLPLLSEIDCVLLMSVNPGFYGAKFIPGVLEKARSLRSRFPELEIGIDGGVKETNLKLIAESGVDSICVGSAIFLSSDPAASFRKLSSLANP